MRKQKAAKRLKTEQTKTQNETLELTSAKKQKKKKQQKSSKSHQKDRHTNIQKDKKSKVLIEIFTVLSSILDCVNF